MEGQMSAVQVSEDTFVAAMKEETERMLREVMAAVNKAPDGAWINGSEMQVRDLLGDYRRRVYEKALQMRTDAVEGAFSPGGPSNRPAAALQKCGSPQHADQQRPREHPPQTLAGVGRWWRDARGRIAGRSGSDGESWGPEFVLPDQRHR